jgi:signal transduction histidine kinase/ActR/RegA family two-component response regulator
LLQVLVPSVRARLLLLVLLVMTPAFMLALYRGWDARQVTTGEMRADLLRVAQRLALEQTQLIEQTHQLLGVLARLPEVRRGETPACDALLEDLLRSRDFYANLGAIDTQGQVYCSGTPSLGRINVADRDYFQRTMETGQSETSTYLIGRVTGKPSLVVTSPVLEASGQPRGLVFATLDLRWLTQVTTADDLPAGAALLVVDRSGIILAHQPDPDAWVGQVLPDAPVVRLLLSQQSGSGEVVDLDGVPRLFGFTPLSRIPSLADARVAVGIPLATAFTPADQALLTNLAVLVVTSLLAAGLAWLAGTALVLRPIQRLVDTAERIRGGDLAARSALGPAAGEFGHLGQTFDAMAAALEARARELQASQQRVIQQERLRALGEMASGIAHDFNNALGMVLGFSELLLRPGALGDRRFVAEHLQLIHTAAHDAAEVVKRLRDFSRPRAADEPLLPVQLNDLIAQVLSLTQPRWRDQRLAQGITIEVVTALRELPLVAAHPSELREGLANLVLNAVDAMPEGGTLTLRTRERGAQVLLEMSDTGLGMAPDVQARIFEPFFTTKGEQGTGLGLAMVHGIVQRHGGSIEVDSTPGQGTIFRILLPAAVQQDPLAAEPEPLPRRQHTLRILLAEDELGLQKIMVSYLELDSHVVTAVGDGAAALARFDPAAFDLVITDLAMPGLSGDQLAAAVKQRSPTTPVIMLTGFGDQANGREPPAGVELVASKPITLSRLRAALAQVVATEAPES